MAVHHGGCHCGKVRYSVESTLEGLVTCNCSYCDKRRSILAFVPADSFRLEAGEEALTEYRFNTGKIQHLFCATCGLESFARGAMPDGTQMVAVNVACIDGIDTAELEANRYDGRSL